CASELSAAGRAAVQKWSDRMRLTPAVILLLLLTWPLAAQEDTRRSQVSAATADALDSLQHDVRAASILPNLTVRDLIDRAGGAEELNKTLRGAEQIGGT